MSVVGTFPGLNAVRRRTIRAPVNPMDKATVVSIYPKPINERKHTIQPGFFHIDPGTYEKPSILVVGPSSWWKDIDEEQPLLEIPNGSIQVADSIVRDYCNGLLGCNMSDTMPGLFWLPGNFSLKEIKNDHIALLDKAKANQDRYFMALIKMGDTLWARTNGNPLAISEDMRIGARILGITGRDWMKDFSMIQRINCIGCGSPRNPDFPVCPTCKTICDAAKAKELGISFAQ